MTGEAVGVKPLQLLFVLPAVLSVALVGCKKRTVAVSGPAPANFVTYSDPQHGVSIKGPPGWQRVTSSTGSMLLLSPANGDAARQTFGVRATDVSGSASLGAECDGAVARLSTTITQFHLSRRTDDLDIGGMPTSKIVYTGMAKDAHATGEWTQYLVRHGTKLYILTFYCHADRADQFRAMVDQMAGSLQAP